MFSMSMFRLMFGRHGETRSLSRSGQTAWSPIVNLAVDDLDSTECRRWRPGTQGGWWQVCIHQSASIQIAAAHSLWPILVVKSCLFWSVIWPTTVILIWAAGVRSGGPIDEVGIWRATAEGKVPPIAQGPIACSALF